MRLPSLQFYPGDWMKDPGLRACSLSARGLWIDLLCLMFESPRRGYLQLASGKAMTAEHVARSTGCSTDDASRLLQELTDSGVASYSDTEGYYSRRLVRDERKRQLCAEAGKKGGNPTLIRHPKGESKGSANPPPTPSSSSSSSSSPSDKSAAAAGACVREAGELDPRIVALSGVGIAPGAAYSLISKHKPTLEAVENYVARSTEPDVNNRAAFVSSAIREAWPIQNRDGPDNRHVNRITQQANAQAERLAKRIASRVNP